MPKDKIIEFNKLSLPIIILGVEDTLFGQDIYHESVEVTDISEIKYDIKNIKSKIGEMEKRFDKRFNQMEERFDRIEEYF